MLQNQHYDKQVGQDDFPSTNTRYIIRYDFTLSENVTIPENCLLVFEGGSLSGSGKILNLNSVRIIPSYNDLVDNTNLTVSGTTSENTFYFQNGRPTWSDGEKWIYADGTPVE